MHVMYVSEYLHLTENSFIYIIMLVILYLVFKAGNTEIKQIQQAVELQYRQICEPFLQNTFICILQDPQETDQKIPT